MNLRYYLMAFFSTWLVFILIFTMLAWMIHPMRGEMNVYVPEDYNITSMEYNKRYGPGGIVLGANDTEIKIVNVMSMYGSGVDNPEELKKYRGEMVCIELSWGSSDDENWYINTITDVEIIYNSTKLSNIDDIHDIDFKKDININWYRNIFLACTVSLIMTVGFAYLETLD